MTKTERPDAEREDVDRCQNEYRTADAKAANRLSVW